MKAAKGETGVVEPTFVYLPGVDGGKEIAEATGCDYFSVPVELGVSDMAYLRKRAATNTPYSPRVPRRRTTFSATSTTTRRNSLRLAPRVSRATSARVLSSSRTPRSRCLVLRHVTLHEKLNHEKRFASAAEEQRLHSSRVEHVATSRESRYEHSAATSCKRSVQFLQPAPPQPLLK